MYVTELPSRWFLNCSLCCRVPIVLPAQPSPKRAACFSGKRNLCRNIQRRHVHAACISGKFRLGFWLHCVSSSKILLTHLCVCLWVSMCVCEWVFVWVSVCEWVSVCVSMCVCVVCVCVCVFGWYKLTCVKVAALFPGSSYGTKVRCQYGGKLCLHATNAWLLLWGVEVAVLGRQLHFLMSFPLEKKTW